ncbi:hypothetical protein [Polaribacter septentrionalilitoris]|uniref:hypothetical protein n=1 Tax=Polaribacter septentrionalilitoris TaxID=2494657 RepID=UPI001357E1D9|nr:hypothetical protein [Polaribacter septentrionalilitoris]
MIIFELTKQGNRLNQVSDDSKNFELDNLIGHLIGTFFEANIALNLYLGEKKNSQLYFKKERENWNNDSELKKQLRKKIELEYPENNGFENFEEINFKVETEFKRHIWAKGRVPSNLKHKLIFIHAKTFLYALDNFEKEFKRLLEDGIFPEQCGSLYNKLIENFPSLRKLRNSAHHQEDRIRGEAYRKKINLKPISNTLVHAPNGGVLIINSLNGDNYGGTLGDGTYGEVEVSIESMNKLQSILQEFLNSLKWKGSQEHLPR